MRAASTRWSRCPCSSVAILTVSISGIAQQMSDQPLNPEAAAAIAKVRRMMIVIITGTFLAIALILVLISYRLFHAGQRVPVSFADVTVLLPGGGKVVSTAVSNDPIVVTIEGGGFTELPLSDPNPLKPLGRLRLEPKP